jgi:hypothetical protein
MLSVKPNRLVQPEGSFLLSYLWSYPDQGQNNVWIYWAFKIIVWIIDLLTKSCSLLLDTVLQFSFLTPFPSL